MIDCSPYFHAAGIIPVITINDAKKALTLGEALVKGGITAAEITFRTEAAPEAIKIMHRHLPELYVCAGTVLSVEDAQKAEDAGARAIISPGTNMDILQWCAHGKTPYIPGILTATEIMTCLKYDVPFVKIFPIEVIGGTSMIKALTSSFPTVKFMPTGGIRPENLKKYLSLDNVIACAGSWIVPEDAVENSDFTRIEQLAREAKNITAEVLS